MFLLITGASCVGKTTVRRAIQSPMAPHVESVELASLISIPASPDVAWRQQSVETVVQYALQLQAEGRHLLLAGDPVPVGELLAVPSAPLLEGIAVCSLDVQADAQKMRLAQRNEPEELWGHHLAFAAWMREHLHNPQHLPVVIRQGAWDKMRWERWENWKAGDARWQFSGIDTSALSRDEVAQEALSWCRAALVGDAPVLRGQWWDNEAKE